MADTTDKDLAADVLLAATRLNCAIARANEAGLQVTVSTQERPSRGMMRGVPVPGYAIVQVGVARPL